MSIRLNLYLPYKEYYFFYTGFLSQWHMRPFQVDGIPYNCAEQYMMAMKARLFKDDDSLLRIMAAQHPKEQKARGRLVRGFDLEQWNAVARLVVYHGNMAKFLQNTDLRNRLEDTKGKLLVEASLTDCVWGIGMTAGMEGVEDPTNWRGMNWLGECLTKVRDDIIQAGTDPYGVMISDG